MKLVVFMEPKEKLVFEESGTFGCKPESIRARAKVFAKAKDHFSYPEPFVSLAVLRDNEDICNSGAYVYAHESKGGAALDFALVKCSETVLGSIDLVGDDDSQTDPR